MAPHTFTAPLVPHVMGEATFQIVHVPAAVAAAIASTGSDRVHAAYDGRAPVQTRLLPFGQDGRRYLLLTAEQRRAWGISPGDEVRVELLPDESAYGMPLPEEWAEALAEDSALDRAFGALTPGRQRRILYVVGKPKTTATRRRKAAASAAYLREVGAEGFDYAGLVAWLKDWR